MIRKNVVLLALILALATHTWKYLGMIFDGLGMLIRGLRERDLESKRSGCASMTVGICGFVGTCYVGLQWISCCLFA